VKHENRSILLMLTFDRWFRNDRSVEQGISHVLLLLTRKLHVAFVILGRMQSSCTLMSCVSCHTAGCRVDGYEDAALYGVDRRMAMDGVFGHVLQRWTGIGLGLGAKMVAQ
jgi:hypothetical protein